MEYRVRFYQNNLWEVVSKDKVLFIASLADCYAWIKLDHKGLLTN